jgi:hypothetical protein
MVTYAWRGHFGNSELNALHAEAFAHEIINDDWWGQVNQHSLGWVCARDADILVGFINICWNGGSHAFILDTVVAARTQRAGVGTGLVASAQKGAIAAGCGWLHVDFEAHLRPFYFDSCGFRPTNAGLIDLSESTMGGLPPG